MMVETHIMEGETCPALPPPVPHETASPKPPITTPNPAEEKASISPKSERASPEPNCAICLGKSENKSFTDSCLHQFCFSCLLEWSKIKAECPLCKQSFKSIIHNVRSNEDYDQYHLRPDDTPYWSPVNSEMRRFRYRTTRTTDRNLENMLRYSVRPFTYDAEVIPPQTRRAGHAHHRRRVTAEFRSAVYQQNLWVHPLPDVTGRYRESSPEFYRLNPAQMHRLVPWLNRELSVLLTNTPTHLVHVMDLVLNLVTRYPIISMEFRAELTPYLGEHTSHFIHEFYSYARSPFDMIGFDQSAEYTDSPHISLEVQSTSDSDSDVIILSDDSDTPPSTFSVLHTRSQIQNQVDQSSPVAGPSGTGSSTFLSERVRNRTLASGIFSDAESSHSSTTVELASEANQAEATFSDPEECVIIGYVKPRHERTPEIITLDSDVDMFEEVNPGVRPSNDNNDLSDIVSTTSSDGRTSSGSEYHPQPKKCPRKRGIKRRSSSSKCTRNVKTPIKKRRRNFSTSASESEHRHKSTRLKKRRRSLSTSDSEIEHRHKSTRLSRKSHKRSSTPDSSSEEEETWSRKCSRKSCNSQPRETWRIMRRDSAGGYKEISTDFHDYNGSGYEPSYSDISGFTSRPKLKSIVITRSAPSDSPNSPLASSSQSPSCQEGGSHHRQRRKSGDHRERKKRKLKRRSSSPTPVCSSPKKKRKKNKKLEISSSSS